MSRSIHCTTKNVFHNKSKREIDEMCDIENRHYQVTLIMQKARYKESMRNSRKIEKLKKLNPEETIGNGKE